MAKQWLRLPLQDIMEECDARKSPTLPVLPAFKSLESMTLPATAPAMSLLGYLDFEITVFRQPVRNGFACKFSPCLSVPHQLTPNLQHACSVWMSAAY